MRTSATLGPTGAFDDDKQNARLFSAAAQSRTAEASVPDTWTCAWQRVCCRTPKQILDGKRWIGSPSVTISATASHHHAIAVGFSKGPCLRLECPWHCSCGGKLLERKLRTLYMHKMQR